MLRERRGTKSSATVPHDPGHDDDAPAGRSGGHGQRRPPSAAEGRTACSPAASPERLALVARFLRGPHHLSNEALRSLGALRRRRFSPGAIRFCWCGAPSGVSDSFAQSSAWHSVRKRLIKSVTCGQPILAGPRIRGLARQWRCRRPPSLEYIPSFARRRAHVLCPCLGCTGCVCVRGYGGRCLSERPLEPPSVRTLRRATMSGPEAETVMTENSQHQNQVGASDWIGTRSE